jgi:hypothetical protein
MTEVPGQYDSSGKDRSGQWPSAGFVATCFDHVFVQKIQKSVLHAHSAKVRNL